ncbi:hypothetical protein [Cerasicoccus arenae]|uniref:Uncharacterized protein n=1 Tax=Cerasicoccus arenae TaxID=424488 RepID=A0A8J3GFC7_9BACT|nr:hypothetical protein [Cerasicoccus arenae]MBK1858494.1 hypothetical protein [Cerasicoccus arenae]GHC10291.1 hypothetical protein GCM10007047_29520 [Cerasicoccus arenae]
MIHFRPIHCLALWLSFCVLSADEVLIREETATVSVDGKTVVETIEEVVPVVETPAKTPVAEPDRDYLFSLLRYLYRWHIDAPMLAEDFDAIDDVVIGYRELFPKTDASDHSRFAEVMVPLARTRVLLKQADYEIEELGLEVKNQRFNVVNVSYERDFVWDPELYSVQVYTLEEVFDWLHETRNDRLFPGQELLALIRKEVQEEVNAERPDLMDPSAPQIVYLAPASEVINEVWIYWESGHHLVHFTSDDDLADIDTWKSELHRVELIDLEEDVVVSALEKPGSNAYITKDWAGRVLFNCIVLGVKLVLPPANSGSQQVIIQ